MKFHTSISWQKKNIQLKDARHYVAFTVVLFAQQIKFGTFFKVSVQWFIIAFWATGCFLRLDRWSNYPDIEKVFLCTEEVLIREHKFLALFRTCHQKNVETLLGSN